MLFTHQPGPLADAPHRARKRKPVAGTA
jgi:hypothetical protein